MRNLPVVFAAVLFAGCAGGATLQPVSLSGPAPASTDQAMECVRRELDDMAYEVPAPSGSGTTTVTGIRVNEQPWWLKMIGYRNTADQITATVTGGQLQVTATSSDPAEGAAGGQATSGASETAARNARELLAACGRGA